MRTAFFADAYGSPYLYPDWAYLLLSSLPTYTFLLCGLFYQLLVLKVMLMTRKNMADLNNRATIIRQEENLDIVCHIVIWFNIFAVFTTWSIDYLLHYKIEINNLSRICILLWSVIVCFMLCITSCCLLAQVDKHYSRNISFVRYTRLRILSILGVLVFAYLYRITFYSWYIFGA